MQGVNMVKATTSMPPTAAAVVLGGPQGGPPLNFQNGPFAATHSLAAIVPLSSLDRRLARRNRDLAHGVSLPDALPSDIPASDAPDAGTFDATAAAGDGAAGEQWRPRGATPLAPDPLTLVRAHSAYNALPELPRDIGATELPAPGHAALVAGSLVDAQAPLLTVEAPGIGTAGGGGQNGGPGGVAGRHSGAGGDAAMPDDPWEQLFGPSPRLL